MLLMVVVRVRFRIPILFSKPESVYSACGRKRYLKKNWTVITHEYIFNALTGSEAPVAAAGAILNIRFSENTIHS